MSSWSDAAAALATVLRDALEIPIVPHPPRSLPPDIAGFFRNIKVAPVAQGANGARFTLVVAAPLSDENVFDQLASFIAGDKSLLEVVDENPTFGEDDEFELSSPGEIEMESVEVGGQPCAAVGIELDVAW